MLSIIRLFLVVSTVLNISLSAETVVLPIPMSLLLEPIAPDNIWDKSMFLSTYTVSFSQTASAGTDATTIAKTQLGFFTTSNCSGSLAGTGFYATPDGTSFSISVGSTFGLRAEAAWNVGSGQLSIADMTTIQSIGITFKSTNSTVPQSNFSGSSFVCIPVTCTAGPAGQCTSASGQQNFTLKTTAAVGDPAEGGIIACTNGGANNLVTPASDNSASMNWANAGTLCTNYSAVGGYTTGWSLPERTPLDCLRTNRGSIGNFTEEAGYWSSVAYSSSDAWYEYFSNGFQNHALKTFLLRVRCIRTF